MNTSSGKWDEVFMWSQALIEVLWKMFLIHILYDCKYKLSIKKKKNKCYN